ILRYRNGHVRSSLLQWGGLLQPPCLPGVLFRPAAPSPQAEGLRGEKERLFVWLADRGFTPSSACFARRPLPAFGSPAIDADAPCFNTGRTAPAPPATAAPSRTATGRRPRT